MTGIDPLQPFAVLRIFDLMSLDRNFVRAVPVCEQLHKDSDQRVLRCTFAPSVGHERHFHSRHFGYAIAGGRMRITDSGGTREVDLATGSSFASDGVAWHEVLNVGNSTVVFLIVEPK